MSERRSCRSLRHCLRDERWFFSDEIFMKAAYVEIPEKCDQSDDQLFYGSGVHRLYFKLSASLSTAFINVDQVRYKTEKKIFGTSPGTFDQQIVPASLPPVTERERSHNTEVVKFLCANRTNCVYVRWFNMKKIAWFILSSGSFQLKVLRKTSSRLAYWNF